MEDRKEILTTGDFRKTLLNAALDVRYGHLKGETLGVMVKALAQVNASMQRECEVHRLLMEMGRTDQKFGALPLANTLEGA